jgi:hypothetical protein
VSRLGAGIVDPNLKHRETALQLYRAVLGAFLGLEFSLQPSINFKGKTGSGQFDRSARHALSDVVENSLYVLVTVSLSQPTSLIRSLWKD